MVANHHHGVIPGHFAHAVVDAGEDQGAESYAQVAVGKWDQYVAGNPDARYVIDVHGKW